MQFESSIFHSFLCVLEETCKSESSVFMWFRIDFQNAFSVTTWFHFGTAIRMMSIPNSVKIERVIEITNDSGSV